MNDGSDWLSSRALLTLKPSRMRWALKSTQIIQQTARNFAEQFSILWPGEKCQSKNGIVEILSFSFWQAFCSATPARLNGRINTRYASQVSIIRAILFRRSLGVRPRSYIVSTGRPLESREKE